MTAAFNTKPDTFRLEEATIEDSSPGDQVGQTRADVVERCISRVRALNGVCSILVTEDNAPIESAAGAIRAAKPVTFPAEAVTPSTILPNLDKYRGPPIEYGRMEATASDPSVQQQFGMIVGIPNAVQINALSTPNIRGERSVTCRGGSDRHPSLGPLPAGAPPACEYFRHLPDALEQAKALDAQYGGNPNLNALPLYGVVLSFKDSFDARDPRDRRRCRRLRHRLPRA